VYERLEGRYVRVIRYMVERSGRMVLLALVLIGLAVWGLTKVPTGFIPTEDQGYAMVTVQLPDGASLERTEKVLDAVARMCQGNQAVERTIEIGGVSPLDNNASLANAGIVYLMLKDWARRGKGQDLLSIYRDLSARLSTFQDARTMVLVPPPIQGLGFSGGFQMQVELTDGSYDFERLQKGADDIVAAASRDAAIRMAFTPLRASAPQVTIRVQETRAGTLGLNLADVYSTVQTYLGSSFVNQFTRFGHQYLVYAQADAPFRRRTEDINEYYVRTKSGETVPLGTVARIEHTQGPAVVSLYNLFPSATINGSANQAGRMPKRPFRM
jgi:HAE1 family hydrophobic/amphiphilic exporter-1